MKKWNNFRFKITWDVNQNPKWWIDLFILDDIVRKVLLEHRDEIELWRVHRMADIDSVRHQLTFLCYTADKTAKSIDTSISAKDTLKVLKDNNLLKEYFWEEKLEKNTKTNIQDGEDNWPIELKKSWPFFIQGVSEMFLELIAQIKNQIPDKVQPSDPISLIERYYVELEKRLLGLWYESGNRAFFHHINAVFGYAPLVASPQTVFGIKMVASF